MKSTLACIALVAAGATGAAAQGVDGAAVFAKACASCHAEGQTSAPTPTALRALPAESILNALTNGRMQVQGSTLTATERNAVALFAAGRGARDAIAATSSTENKCTASGPMANAATAPGWNGWGNGVTNTRFASTGGISAADLPRLKLKWAFGYSGVSAARAQRRRRRRRGLPVSVTTGARLGKDGRAIDPLRLRR